MGQKGQKVAQSSYHDIDATVADKIKQISPKFSRSFCEQRLGYSFYIAVKSSLQIILKGCIDMVI